MKIFIIRYGTRVCDEGVPSAFPSGNTPIVSLRPDSSLLTGGRPFFVPDTLGRVMAERALAARICRLGKSIPVRFAHRYYDALTVGIVFTAADLQERLRAAGRPDDLAIGFDGSVCVGEWMAVPTGAHRPSPLTLLDEALAYVSRTMTLKTGDLLLLLTGNEPREVHIGDHMEEWMEDRKVVEFNCK